MTRASPTAATAMIAACTATWLRLSVVRNWGAAIETRPPSTNMIASRLSSRWRATAASHVPRGAGGAAGASTPGSAMSRCAGGVAGAGFGIGGLAGRREHDPLGRCLAAGDLSRDPTLVQDDDPVGHG